MHASILCFAILFNIQHTGTYSYTQSKHKLKTEDQVDFYQRISLLSESPGAQSLVHGARYILAWQVCTWFELVCGARYALA